jgi:hypothetical protein
MMSTARFKAVHQHITSAAKKVYEAVPINEMWTTSQIVTEMQRMGITSMDYHIAAGCINSLITSGLVCEPKRAHFTRTPIRERAPARTTKEEVDDFVAQAIASTTIHNEPTPAMNTTPAKHQSPIDILGALATRASQLGDGMKRLAIDIENAALQIEEQKAVDAAALDKLKQLQSLLQSLNSPQTTTA